MTKVQKKRCKKISSSKNKRKFLKFIVNQQTFLGKFKHWEKIYEKKCMKKGLVFKNLLSKM